MNATVVRENPEPIRASATGAMRTTVSREHGEDRGLPRHCVEGRHQHRPEEEPDDEGEEPAALGVDSSVAGSSEGPWTTVPKARPPTNALMNPSPPSSIERVYAKSASANTPTPRYVGDEPASRGQGEQVSPDESDGRADEHPDAQLREEPPSDVEACVIVSATAPAMKKLTNGVAMPSFRPLSTLRIRRMGGHMLVLHDRAPSAASVGATAAAITAAAHGSRSGKSTTARAVPRAMVSGRPTSRRRVSTPASWRNTRRFTRRRVGEEQEREGHLEQGFEASPVHVDVDGGHRIVGSTRPRTTNAIGALTLSASNFAETSPHAISDAAMATIRPVSSVSIDCSLRAQAWRRRSARNSRWHPPAVCRAAGWPVLLHSSLKARWRHLTRASGTRCLVPLHLDDCR